MSAIKTSTHSHTSFDKHSSLQKTTSTSKIRKFNFTSEANFVREQNICYGSCLENSCNTSSFQISLANIQCYFAAELHLKLARRKAQVRTAHYDCVDVFNCLPLASANSRKSQAFSPSRAPGGNEQKDYQAAAGRRKSKTQRARAHVHTRRSRG